MKNLFSTFNKVSLLRGRFWHWLSATAQYPLLRGGELIFAAEPQAYQVPVLVIAGRQHYREVHKSYPITNRRELGQVLGYEYADAGYCQHFMLGADEHSQQVNSYIYAADFVSRLPACCLLVPESLLLSFAFASQVLIEVRAAQPYYLYRQQYVHSVRQSALCPDQNRFRLAAGVPDDAPVQVLEPAQLPAIFEQAVALLPLRFWRSMCFVNPSAYRLNWRPLAGAFAAGVLLSGLLTLAGTQWLISRHSQTLESYGADVDELLAKQNQTEQMQADIRQLSEVIHLPDHHLSPWLLAHTIQDKSLIQQMSVQGDMVILRGIALKATDVLKALLESGLVSEAVFDAPTVEDNGQETFVIKARMQQKVSTDAK